MASLKLDNAHRFRESASVVTHSAISVVSALASGRGVTVGIKIPCKVSVQIIEGRAVGNGFVVDSPGSEDRHGLVRTCVLAALRCVHQEEKVENTSVRIRSSIPQAVGLKSSSAISCA